jgi:hypothetical protein
MQTKLFDLSPIVQQDIKQQRAPPFSLRRSSPATTGRIHFLTLLSL